MIYHSLYFYNLFNLYDLFFKFFNFHNLWYFSFHFNELLDNSRYLYYSFNDIFEWNYLLNHAIVDNWLLQRHINYPVDLFNFLNLNNLFDYSVNCDYLRNLYDFLHDFLNDFFNFDNFWNNSKDFENVIDIDNTHNLLSDHTDYSFIHFRN